MLGSSASWVSDMMRKRTGFVERGRFAPGEGVGDGERVRLEVGMFEDSLRKECL